MSSNLDLLRQIEDDAVSSKIPVTELLRRVQLFASRAKLPELGDWVRYELNGYPRDVELPSYRVVYGIARGHFIGPFGSGMRNAVLPAGNLPKEFREWGEKAYLRQPIVALEEVANDKDREGGLSFAWPGDLIARVQDKFYENMALAQAWLSVSQTDFLSAVDTVRNRILSFALEAESLVATENPSTPSSVTAAGLTQVFHNHIYGPVSNLAQGSHGFSQHSGVGTNDLGALLRELTRLGVPQEDVNELQEAITDDGAPKHSKLGSRVAGWLGTMVAKAASGVWSVSTSTAAAVLPKLISSYYGLPSS